MTMIGSQLLQGGQYIVNVYQTFIAYHCCIVNHGIGTTALQSLQSKSIAIKSLASKGKNMDPSGQLRVSVVTTGCCKNNSYNSAILISLLQLSSTKVRKSFLSYNQSKEICKFALKLEHHDAYT